MAGGFFGNFSGNLNSGFDKLKNGNISQMNDWEEWAALATTTAITIGILSALFNMIRSFWEENKSLFIMLGLAAAAVVGIPWLMKQFGGKGDEAAAAPAPVVARRGRAAPLGDDDVMPKISFRDNEVGAPRKIDIAMRNADVQLGGVEYADFLPQGQPLRDGLPEEIALLQARARAEQNAGISA